MIVESKTDELANLSPGELSVDTILSLFRKRRRRLIIGCLNRHDVALPLADVAKEVVAAENGVPLPDTDDDEVFSVYLNLYHNDIPRLANHDIVEYERGNDVVRLSEDSDRLLKLFALLEGDEDGE
ncbi:hypothetical protein V5735_17865 (plasmid) [Haladaptatus sp. SPP-AMP-3]|uniref:DUF7344 domain-containing protein n=1 Tax=Haladaptatus sp. SPP-AMP-3 TaxID=3121295 RepID=UPI003C309D56